METEKFIVAADEVPATIRLSELRKFILRAVYCTVSASEDDKADGLVRKTYVGSLCNHHEGGFCVQTVGNCFPVEAGMELEILPMTWREYQSGGAK